ncbi:hypothetical protein BGZ83_005471 [Gryganskiella cystojenkinii]|nr:hypothetical protein BGZ83_005471 [Gryganskiella cystojenkinii]
MTTAIQFVSVASLVPDQHSCNLKLRVLSVEAIAETIHPETGRVVQSAEAIVGDDTACILLNLKNDQVNLLARNARLQLLNAKVNMYRGFMRLQVDEEDETCIQGVKPSITAISDDEADDEDGVSRTLNQDDSDSTTATTIIRGMNMTGGDDASIEVPRFPRRGAFVLEQSALFASAGPGGIISGSVALSSPSSPIAASISPGTFSNSLASRSSTSLSSSSTASSPSSSRDQLDVEMRLGTGGSVPLVEYYRTIEFTYFSAVEPVGR